MTAILDIVSHCLDCRVFKCDIECPLFGLAKAKSNIHEVFLSMSTLIDDNGKPFLIVQNVSFPEVSNA